MGSKLLKVFTHITKGLKDFDIEEKGWQWEEGKPALMWWVVQKEQLEPHYIQQGPPIDMKDNVERFKKQHKKTFLKDGVVFAQVKRECVKPGLCVKKLIKDDYVTKRVVSIKHV